MDIDKFYDWENMSVSGIIYVMVQWLNIRNVDFTTTQRPKVESGIWYDLTVKDENFNPIWHVSSQKQSLLKERLIAELDKRNYRENYLKERVVIAKPKVVCFCGSTRFAQYFMIERWKLEKQGIITLGINILPDGYFAGENHHGAEQEGVKHILDELHKRKIDLADEVVILNVDGYIGDSTRAELNYAIETGKTVRYLEPNAATSGK